MNLCVGKCVLYVNVYTLCVWVCAYIVKCESKALLVGCNAGITAIDIDLDVSDCLLYVLNAAFHADFLRTY